jgi:hypothetical protein
MRAVLRPLLIAFLAIGAAVLLALTSTMTSVFTFTAATVLIMGGTGHPLTVPPDTATFIQTYLNQDTTNYVTPASIPATSSIPGPPYTQVAVITPEQFRFDTGLTDMTYDQSVAVGQQSLDGCIKGTSACNYNPAFSGAPYNTPPPQNPPAASPTNPMIVFGYSQSATIATLEKQDLIDNPSSAPPQGSLSFVLIGNPNRPNGGFLARGPQGFTIPIIGATFSGPTPTSSGTTPENATYPTVDIAQQYDGWADGPVNPLNLLADANAVAGVVYLHPNYGSVSLNDPNVINQGTYGDTQYYLIGTYPLPLLMPLESIPVVGLPLADTLDPPLRVLVESAYDRNISPGVPTSWNPLYFPNPVTTGVNFLAAIPTGLDNGISDFTGIRPFGTARPGAYGVGGLPTPVPTPTPVSSPTIPVLFGSPGGIFALFADPTTLLADLTTFSQLTSLLTGGLPLGIPSLANPLGGLPNLGSVLGQSPIVPGNIVPAVESSPKDTSTTTTSTTTTPRQLVADRNANSNWAPKNGVKNDVAQGSSSNTPQQQSSATNPAPRLNVSRPSPWLTPGSQFSTSSTSGSQPAAANPIGSAISGVTSSVKSALGTLSKVGGSKK